MNNLKDKTAIVTGGGQGLGKAVAVALAQEGVHIGLIGRNEEKLKATLAELQALNAKAYYSVCSVDDEQAVIKSVAELAEALGGIDILINNAGIDNFGSIESMSSDEWQQVIKTNLFGPYFTAKAVYPYLQAKGAGDIVNVSSTAGLKAGGNMSAYAASKAALISLSQSMMAEWRKQNIRVITLTPSTIASEMSINGGLTDGNPETVLQPEDFAEWVRDILKMNRRALIANGSIFSNNP